MEPMVTKLKRDAYQSFAQRLMRACSDRPDMPKKGERGLPKALGALAGIGYKGAEKWIKGEGMPDMGHAAILADRLNIGFEWLMTGRGPMRPHYVQEETPLYSRRNAGPIPEPVVDPVSIEAELDKLPSDVSGLLKRLVVTLAAQKGKTRKV